MLKRKMILKNQKVKEMLQQKADLIAYKKERKENFRVFVNTSTKDNIINIGVTTNGFQKHCLPDLSKEEAISLAIEILSFINGEGK